MKFFNKKPLTFSSILAEKYKDALSTKAFTLAELIASMAIISILVLVVFVFTTTNIENLANNTIKVATVEGGLSLEEFFSTHRDKGFTLWEIIEIPGNNPNQVLLLKTPDNENGVLLGIVNANSWTLQQDYTYGNNFIGYLELTGVEAVTDTGVFWDLEFPEGNIFRNLRARDFRLTEYNAEEELLDISISIIRALDKSIIGTPDADFDKLGDDILVTEFNLVY